MVEPQYLLAKYAGRAESEMVVDPAGLLDSNVELLE
jgi:hypothetical protein